MYRQRVTDVIIEAWRLQDRHQSVRFTRANRCLTVRCVSTLRTLLIAHLS